ncbi:MAG TPA: hypothetical protein VKM54_27255 [Myxococcota bacterium]|nr:hypothetical protein [Myxococcota bacterium]
MTPVPDRAARRFILGNAAEVYAGARVVAAGLLRALWAGFHPSRA